MRTRKLFLGVCLMLAVAFLGVGFAAIQTTLTVNGTASAKADDSQFTVKFKQSDTYTKTASEGLTANDVVTVTRTSDSVLTVAVAGLKKTGDYGQTTFTIENASAELSAKITASVTQVTGTYASYFTVTLTPAEEQTVAANETQVYTLKVTLNKTPVEDIEAQNFTVTFTATAQAAA